MLNGLVGFWEDLLIFFETGGEVLVVLFGVTFLMWTIIVERFFFLRARYPEEAATLLHGWQGRSDKASWYADQVKAQLCSQVRQELTRFLPLLKTLIALCPLLGLLGTVTGMIEVFYVMAISGSGNPRAMASGVSRATVPTMAGMVAALSGVYFSARLNRLTQKETRLFQDQLG